MRVLTIDKAKVRMLILLWILIAVLVGTNVTGPITDPDLWWHITVGRWILSHQTIPYVDYWNVFGHGLPWRAYSWSSEVLYAGVEAVWGLVGIAWLKMVVAIFVVLALQYLFSAMSGSYFLGCLLGILTTAGFANHFTLRPQLLAWVLFGSVLFLVDRCCSHKVTRSRCVLLVLLGCCWTNTHLSAIIGVIGAFLWARQDKWGEESYRRPLIVTGSFVLGTLISPYFGGEWITLFSKSDHVFQFSEIVEFGALTIKDRCAGILLIQIVLLVVLSYNNRLLPSFSRIVLALGCVLVGALIVKFIPFAVVCLSAILARWFRDYEQGPEKESSSDRILAGVKLLQTRVCSLQIKTMQAVGFFMVCLIIFNCVQFHRNPMNREMYPWNAVDFIRKKNLHFPIAHGFGQGGFMMYQFSDSDGTPIERVVIDGRTNVNPPAIWTAFQGAQYGRREWEDYLEKTKAKTVVWKESFALSSLLRLSTDWCEVVDGASNPDKFSVFISRDEFESRRDEFVSTDCGA